MTDNQGQEAAFHIARYVLSVLLPRVVEKGSAITYGDLSKAIKDKYGEEINPHVGFNYALARLLDACSELDLPCLSVMVVNQKWQPGTGFIPYYREVHPEAINMSDSEIRLMEERNVKACTDWSALLDYFEISAEELGDDYQSRAYIEGGREIKERLVVEAKRVPSLCAECLQKRGTRCLVCEFDSAETYGIPGIIEVHHINPLADGNERETDPEKDLVPVCPNCHALLHKKPGATECYSVNEARAMLGKPPLD